MAGPAAISGDFLFAIPIRLYRAIPAQRWIVPAEISELSDFQWFEHQFLARVFA
jgi:hypothetical protein